MAPPIDVDLLNRVRTGLLERKARLDRDMRDREKEQVELERVESQPEMVDLAQSLELIERNSFLQEQERRELATIDAALLKIAKGDYGRCEECAEAIPIKRLVAVPEARFCARCQAIFERERERTRAG